MDAGPAFTWRLRQPFCPAPARRAGLGGGRGEIDPLEDGAWSGVTLALVEFDDAGVAAIALLEGGGEFLEEDADDILVLAPGLASGLVAVETSGLVTEAGRGEVPGVGGARFAEGDHFFGDRAGGLGAGQGGGDAFVFDEAGDQGGQDGIAMFAGAAELGGSFPMTHNGSSGLKGLGFLLDRKST